MKIESLYFSASFDVLGIIFGKCFCMETKIIPVMKKQILYFMKWLREGYWNICVLKNLSNYVIGQRDTKSIRFINSDN